MSRSAVGGGSRGVVPPPVAMAGVGMTTCSTNGSGQGGASANEGAKACTKFAGVGQEAIRSLNPSKWGAAIQSGLRSTDSTLRMASERAQSAIKDRDVSAFVSELQEIPRIWSNLTRAS